MDGFSRITEAYISHYNKLFWLLFLLAGIMFVATAFTGSIAMSYTDIILGLVLVISGVHRIGEEFFSRSVKKTQEDSVRTINELLQWAEKSYDYTREFKDKHEKRLHRLDVKRAEHEEKTEEMFRDAVRKIIQMENRINKALKDIEKPAWERPFPVVDTPIATRPEPAPMTHTAPRVSVPVPVRASPKPATMPRLKDLNKTQAKAVQHLRKAGKITNKEYRKLFRVTEKKAYGDLTSMYGMGLLKRKGKGRSTHYVLAF